MKKYKYLTPPDDMEVVYLLVVSELRWNDDHSNGTDAKADAKYVKDTLPKILIDSIPTVGDITWVHKVSITNKTTKELDLNVSSVHIERNRFGANIHPSCFEILHTSKQKIRK